LPEQLAHGRHEAVVSGCCAQNAQAALHGLLPDRILTAHSDLLIREGPPI
jgi:hypothetical protein